MGVVAGLTAAAAAAATANSVDQMVSGPSGGGGGGFMPMGGGNGSQQPNLGSAAGQLWGFMNPATNALSGLGIGPGAYQPISSLNLTTPGFSNDLTVNNGRLTSNLTTNPSDPFQASLTGIMQSLGNLSANAGSAGNAFLQNVLGTNLTGGGLAPILAPLQQIEMARQKGVSDIQGTLAARGLEGSSFATNALSANDAQFGQASASAAQQLAQGLFSNQLQTLQQQGSFINQQAGLANSELGREIQQLQIQGQIGTSLQSSLTQNSAFLSQLAARATAGQAAALTNLGQTLGTNLTSSLGLGSLGGGPLGGALQSLLGIGGSNPPQALVDQLNQIQQSPASWNWNGFDQGGAAALSQPSVGLDGTVLPGAFGEMPQ